MCGSVCLGLYKVHAHGDCCGAVHACAFCVPCLKKILYATCLSLNVLASVLHFLDCLC
jgi:hypothetical protein